MVPIGIDVRRRAPHVGQRATPGVPVSCGLNTNQTVRSQSSQSRTCLTAIMAVGEQHRAPRRIKQLGPALYKRLSRLSMAARIQLEHVNAPGDKQG
jgi:hypothetical protein